MPKTIPCLWFDTDAEAAAALYVSVFPNSAVTGVTHYGPDTHRPEGLVLTVSFTLDGQEYVALNGGPAFTFSEAISFQILCADQAEVDHYWNALTADGGKESQCGWLTDRFGLSWQVVPTRLIELTGDPDPRRAQRATQAMLTMGKINIGALERAADAR
ncbi:VOC family protein [Parafrankia discariae]|uniref:VOC family protein n=1 Tax=Parafrankia discariae TaxID=365528 RepID=UPI000376F45A|nr:VOC family protein [Parafrankia discariae]